MNDAEGFVGRFVRAAGNPLTTLESPSILITGDSVCWPEVQNVFCILQVLFTAFLQLSVIEEKILLRKLKGTEIMLTV